MNYLAMAAIAAMFVFADSGYGLRFQLPRQGLVSE